MSSPRDEQRPRVSRRAVVATSAWAVPAVVVAGAAPAYANSQIVLSLNSPSSLTTDGLSRVDFPLWIANMGSVPTAGQVTLVVPRPSSGTLGHRSVPAGWSASNVNGTLTFTSSVPIVPSAPMLQFAVTFTPADDAPAPVDLRAHIVEGSGGAGGTSSLTAASVMSLPDLEVSVSAPAVMTRAGTTVDFFIDNVGNARTTSGIIRFSIARIPGTTVSLGPVNGFRYGGLTATHYTFEVDTVIYASEGRKLWMEWKSDGSRAGETATYEILTSGPQGGEANQANNKATASVVLE